MQIVIVLLIVAAVIAAVLGGIRAKRKRRELFEGLARRLNCRYHEDDPFGLAHKFEPYFPTLRQGDQRYAYNVISGHWNGMDLRIFDHHHETYSQTKNGRQTHHHHRTFVLVDHDVDLGELDVRPERMFDKLKAVFGYDDIDFESAEFSTRWHVAAADRKFAYALFHPRMMEYFLTLSGFKLSTSGRWGLYRIGSARMDGPAIHRTLAAVDGFLEQIPRFVRKDRAL